MVKFSWVKRVRHLLTIIFIEILCKSYLWLLKKHKYFTQWLLWCSIDFYLTQLSNIIILAAQAKRLKAYNSIKQNSHNYNAVSLSVGFYLHVYKNALLCLFPAWCCYLRRTVSLPDCLVSLVVLLPLLMLGARLMFLDLMTSYSQEINPHIACPFQQMWSLVYLIWMYSGSSLRNQIWKT